MTKRDAAVNVRMAFDMKARLRKLADAEMMSLSTYIVRVLRKHLETIGSAPEPSPTKR